MAHTYTSLCYHLVFSTKGREPWLHEGIQDRVWAYLGGIARDNEMSALCVGGTVDHAHLIVKTKPTMAVSRMMQLLKGGSSVWMHETFPPMKRFSWQDGYGAFTISTTDVPNVMNYIRNQREHHRVKTFQEEYLDFLNKYGVEYDERYLWD
jgi:putative transposase